MKKAASLVSEKRRTLVNQQKAPVIHGVESWCPFWCPFGLPKHLIIYCTRS
jgi:hypothetical protein